MEHPNRKNQTSLIYSAEYGAHDRCLRIRLDGRCIGKTYIHPREVFDVSSKLDGVKSSFDA
jgi:hypothetical protein